MYSSPNGTLSDGASANSQDQQGQNRQNPPAPAYTLIRTPEDLAAVHVALAESTRFALDLETTGLNPRQDRIRLLSLGTDRGIYRIDAFRVDPAPLFPLLAAKPVLAHHAAFDLGFLAQRGFEPGVVSDTCLRAQLLAAGTDQRCTLAACVARELGPELDKTLQDSDWSAELTAEQLAYAARDVAVLGGLWSRGLPSFMRNPNLIRAAGLGCFVAGESCGRGHALGPCSSASSQARA